jgi:hypothetical protein
MWTPFSMFAAEAQTVGIDPTVAFGALITGVVSVIAAVITVMFSMSKHADERVDAASKLSLDRLVIDLEECRGETLSAEKDIDLWRQKCTKLEIENASLKTENRRLKRQDP